MWKFQPLERANSNINIGDMEEDSSFASITIEENFKLSKTFFSSSNNKFSGDIDPKLEHVSNSDTKVFEEACEERQRSALFTIG